MTDDTQPEDTPGSQLVALPPEDEHRLEVAVRALTDRQAAFMNALLKNCLVAAAACRELGPLAPSRKSIAVWGRDPKYVRALNLAKAAALQRAGIEAASVLLRINDLVESGREPITTTDCNGNTDTHPRDAASAGANLKLLAQFVGVAQSEAPPATRTGPGLVIQFIHGEQKPVGVTIEQVPADAINLPEVQMHEHS